MKNKRYDEIMDTIQVTEEMRSRILQNIQKAEIKPAEKAKVVRFSSFKKYMALAACFAVALVGTLTVSHLLTSKPSTEQGGLTQGNEIITVASAKELSEAVGFEVSDVVNIPFTVEEAGYISYWQELAEINYSGEGHSLTYRKSAGAADNSGDYNAYAVIADRELQGVTFKWKGNGELYYLAVWNTNGYSYSLSFKEGVDEATLIGLLESNLVP